MRNGSSHNPAIQTDNQGSTTQHIPCKLEVLFRTNVMGSIVRRGCAFSGCAFSGCAFSGCTFNECTFSGCASPNVVTSCQRRRVSPNVVTSCQRRRRVSPNIHSSRTQGTPQSLNTLPIITPAFLCVPHTYVQECRPHIHAVHTAHTNEWCTSADSLTSPPPISIK